MKILIIKTSALGDVIQCFPALDFLHRLFEAVEIDWVIEKPFAELLQAHPYIDHIYEIETKKWKRAPLCMQNWKAVYTIIKRLRGKTYDLAIDFQGNLKSGLVLSCVKSGEKVGYNRKAVPEWPNCLFTSKKVHIDLAQPITMQYLTLAAAAFPNTPLEGSPLIQLKITSSEKTWIESQLTQGIRMMVCLGSNWDNKKLSNETWEAFLKKVEARFFPTFYFVWGNEKEKKEVEKLHQVFSKRSLVLPQMSLPVWQQMMAHMDVVFSVDSSALHLAATTNTRTYGFFGPSSPHVYKPVGQQHGFFYGNCPYGEFFTKRCPKLRDCKTGACLKNVFSDVLFEQFSAWYQQ